VCEENSDRLTLFFSHQSECCVQVDRRENTEMCLTLADFVYELAKEFRPPKKPLPKRRTRRRPKAT
jgi:hypothetical protein